MINIGLPDNTSLRPKISVISFGGGGGNAVNNLIKLGVTDIECIAANTDAQALNNSLCAHKIQLGASLTRGLGAGASPDIGRRAAKESIREVLSCIRDSNMVFIAAGMGGGTGTGASPLIAKYIKKIRDDEDEDDMQDSELNDLIPDDILVVGVVTKPFDFEGSKRMMIAELGIERMQRYVDTLIVLPNQNLFRVINEKTSMQDAFRLSDTFLASSVREISNLIIKPGLINLDFADIKTVMSEKGKAMIGIGTAYGENRAIDAADAAISNPLLDNSSMKGAKAVLINISGGDDLTLFEVDAANNRVKDLVDSDANIIFGSTFNGDADGGITVSVVATGIGSPVETKKNRIVNDKVVIKKKVLVTSDGSEDLTEESNDSDDDSFSSKRNIIDPDDLDDEDGGSKGFFNSFTSVVDGGDLNFKKNISGVSDIPAFLRRNKK